MIRGFEVVSKYQDQAINLPKRATKQAAGYDFESSVDMVLPSIWRFPFLKALSTIKSTKELSAQEINDANATLKPYLIPTGIKAFMQPNEVLIIANRSSNPLKRGLVVPNGIGVIDADYYNNDANEGEIFIQMVNLGITDMKIKKGDRIGQGIFMPYLTTDNDNDDLKQTRSGGFGSSGK
ncbi:dUTP diphosphatase [Lentilactobacillus senioris DSM 24302 = JCM 17472]|uniref:dUTP diphosphatase n=1 Tax=Lentilactobacillus senioris DSM 24302 = JCM 17472 TaxID=1423802 RepID=A0A0R2CNX7_9LACO|nr:dUTP diphosphatase [Lentilactobacillus senioris]KRM93405.1 dUTP diphosphatase [Lentilactobacillus senioris DSM 24302 = JCM 17472]